MKLKAKEKKIRSYKRKEKKKKKKILIFVAKKKKKKTTKTTETFFLMFLDLKTKILKLNFCFIRPLVMVRRLISLSRRGVRV